MYSSYESLISMLDANENEIIRISRRDDRVAIAILLYSSVHADGQVRQEEMTLYRHLLESYLNVPEDEFIMFEKAVSDICRKPDSINSIISIIQAMPENRRREVLCLMKDIALSDSMFHEMEVNLMSRTALLLGLSQE